MFYVGDRVIFMYSNEGKLSVEGVMAGESDNATGAPDRYCKLVNVPLDWVYQNALSAPA